MGVTKGDVQIMTNKNDDQIGGTFIGIAVFFIVLLLFMVGTCSSDSKKVSSDNESEFAKYDEIRRNSDDPITWRQEEEKLERKHGLDKLPYSCKRCGMKSDRPFEGAYGTNGTCAYCMEYLRNH